MDPELSQRLTVLEQKVDAMYKSVESLRKYFLWTGIITIALFVLPLIGLVFAIPQFLSYYNQIGTIDSSNSTDSVNTLNSLLQ